MSDEKWNPGLAIQPGTGDQLIFVTAEGPDGKNRTVTWLTRNDPPTGGLLTDRDRAVLRAFLALAQDRLDALDREAAALR